MSYQPAPSQSPRSLAEDAGAATWRWNPGTGEIPTDESWARLLGLDTARLLPLTPADWEDLIHPDDRAESAAGFARLRAGEIPIYERECRIRHRDGRWIWVRDHGRVTESTPQGKPVAILGTRVDITAQKQQEAEMALRAKTEELDRYWDSALDLLCIADTDGYFRRVNPSWEHLLGYPLATLQGCRFLDLVHPDDRRATEEALARLATQQPVLQFANRYRHRDGSYRWIEWRAFPQGPLVYAVARDITEHRRTIEALQASELALRAREQEFRMLADSIPQVVWMCQPDGRNTYFNQRWMEYTGLTLEESLGEGWIKPFHPDDRERAWVAWNRATLGGATYDLECRLRRSDGAYRWFIIRGLPLRDAEGRIVQWFGTCTDIHDRRLSEEALRLSEEKFAAAFANNPAAIALTRLEDGRFVDVNETWCTLTGYSRDEALDRTSHDLNLWQDPKARETLARETREQGSVRGRELAFRSKSGQAFFAQVSTQILTIRGEQVILSTLVDTTERRKAEAALRTSEERLRFALETSHIGGWELNLVDHTAFRTLEHARIFGYPELLPHWTYEQFLEHVLPEDRAEVDRRVREATAHRTDWSFECRIRRADGEVRWIWVAGGHQLGTAAEPRRVAGIVQDITDRVQAREALQESEQRLGLASRSAGLGVWDWDLRNNRLTWDDQMFRLYGMSQTPDSSGVELWEQAVLPADLPRAKADSQAALRGERDYVSEFRIRRPDGAVRHIQAHGLVLRDKSGQPVRMLGVNSDITDRKTLEEQLRQSQKLESIGQLAGGVAHDFNNILAASMLHLGPLQQHPNLDPPIQEALRELMSQTQRGANLTRQLLMFGRRSHLEIRLLDLNDLIGNLLAMLRRLIGEHIVIHFSRTPSLPGIEADPTMVEQVLVNLSVNARDAMPRGGSLAIALDAIEVTADTPIRPGSRPGRFVRLSVSDTGCGMDDTVLQHLFEPFFTTKAVGLGTGLGLATVHGIVGQHRGWIEVTSKVGQGTTFRVHLPAVAPAPATAPAPAPRPELHRGHETLLLVEDEPTVRRVMGQTLRILGYRIHEADSAPQALELWNRHRDEIDLVISDMVMPGGMTGLELAARLRESKPDLKVVISSGYNTELMDPSSSTAKSITYLQKPYRREALSKAIRQCLDGA